MRYFNSKSAVLMSLALGFAVALSGCSRVNAADKRQVPPPPEVQVALVQQKDVPIQHEWVGTLAGMVNADIKAEVTGYILTQNYTEGAFVNKGQLLFEIDARPFQAVRDQAKGQFLQANGQLAQAKALLAQNQAQLLQAQASERKTQLDVDRYTPLARQQAITQQDLDNAIQDNLSAEAQVEAAKAQIETAKAQIQAAEAAVEASKATEEAASVNLGFTRINSPIAGIAGKAAVQIGNLVSPTTGAITTVSTLDPIRAEFTVSEQEYLTFMRSGSNLDRLQLDLILADGTTYAHKGKFMFADRQVDATTGAIVLTGIFPNPGNMLRPGQYAKVRATTGVRSGALLVPQAAVTQLQGGYEVAVVDQNNRSAIRNVRAGERIGTMWLIEDGLNPGERVVIAGQQALRPGTTVQVK